MEKDQFETLMLAITGLDAKLSGEIASVKTEMQDLRADVKGQLTDMDKRVSSFEFMTRLEFDKINARFDQVDTRFDRLDGKLEITFKQVGETHVDVIDA